MDDLEDDPISGRQIEGEAALGVGDRLGAAGPVKNDCRGDGIIRAADDLAPDFGRLGNDAERADRHEGEEESFKQ
jgi:hypothetical protein